MIVLTLAGLLLIVQALLVLNVVCGDNPRGERAWGTMLVGAEPQPSAIFGAADSARDAERTKIVERFASAYVELGTWAGAYRRCYDAERMTNATVWREAHAMSNYPGVRDRVRELLSVAAQRAIVTVAEVLRAQMEIATANPADVVRVSEHNCRHCNGAEGGYQWRERAWGTMLVGASLLGAFALFGWIE